VGFLNLFIIVSVCHLVSLGETKRKGIKTISFKAEQFSYLLLFCIEATGKNRRSQEKRFLLD
jgi:hypothetical protein